MATTTATISISSSDIADNSFSVSNTSTLYTAGTNTGISETTGLGRKKLTQQFLFTFPNNIFLVSGPYQTRMARDV